MFCLWFVVDGVDFVFCYNFIVVVGGGECWWNFYKVLVGGGELKVELRIDNIMWWGIGYFRKEGRSDWE